MGAALGESLVTGVSITEINFENLSVNQRWQAEHVFNSAPWHAWKHCADLPASIAADVDNLHHAAIDVDYVPETLASKAHWIYEPDESLTYHRKLLRSNFCPGSRGYWTETNSTRSSGGCSWSHTNPYAYPVNTLDKPACMARILDWAAANHITGFGRWGTWEHMNSDIAVKNALALGQKVLQQASYLRLEVL
jgi:hypothetical protein